MGGRYSVEWFDCSIGVGNVVAIVPQVASLVDTVDTQLSPSFGFGRETFARGWCAIKFIAGSRDCVTLANGGIVQTLHHFKCVFRLYQTQQRKRGDGCI